MIDLDLDIQVATEAEFLPTDKQMTIWAKTALEGQREQAEISVRIVDEEEMQTLNHRFRGKDKPTNVLSFPFDMPAQTEMAFLGDIALCAAVINREALEQKKTSEAHWAHIFIHGILHLTGFDHETKEDADVMEAKEIKLLASLGISDPYAEVIIND